MGWAAFNLERTKTATGEKIGNITIIAPKVENVFSYDYPYNFVPISTLLTYPDYPIEASRFTPPDTYQSALNYGFANTLNVIEYQGETWKLNNGSQIRISDKMPLPVFDNTKGVKVNYYKPGGAYYYEYSIPYVDGDAPSSWTSSLDSILPVIIVQNETQDGAPVKEIFNGNGVELNSRVYPPGKLDKSFYNGATPVIESDDPYDAGGRTETGGGTGTFSDTGDDIAIPNLPSLSATSAGFITLFNPTLGEMNNLASYMWSDLFDVNGWKKVFADPMQAILGLSIVPVAVPSGGAKEVKVGNISTSVSMTVAASQYVVVDCGTLDIKEFWGAYLDYDPYTKVELYLPYIGTHPIATDDIMGKSVHIVYHVDILSGACCAYVSCGGTVLYSFVGQCASSIPITGDNWTNVINGAISIAGSIGSMVATGGASAPMALGNIASTAVNQMKPSVEKSGSMGGTGGMLGVQTPYLIVTRPRQALPLDQNAFTGYPSFITEKLGDLTGYTEIEMIHLEGVPATENEISEIESLLKRGVIF